MQQLLKSLQDWGSESFPKTLKAELEVLESGVLPLAKAGNRGGAINDSDISVSFISVSDDERSIEAKVGVFFYEIGAGGACGDAPVQENAYCEMKVSIDKETAEAGFSLLLE